jgi:hypothetical protein
MNKKQVHTKGSALGALVVAAGGIISALTDADTSTMPDWNAFAVVVMLCYNAWWSRQSNVSSEDVGATPKPGGP